MAQAKLAEADAQRYENLIKTGDVSQSAYDKARTQADTAKAQANSARQQYEAALNSARQNFQGVMTAQASLAGARAQTAMAQKAVDDTVIRAPFAGYVSARPVGGGPVRGADVEDRDRGAGHPIKLELQVPESNAPQMKMRRRCGGERSRLSGPHVPRQGDGDQSGGRLELPHRLRWRRSSPIRIWRSSPACSPPRAFC